VGGPGSEKLRIASWHIPTLPHEVPSTCGQVSLIHTKIWWASGLGNSPQLQLPSSRATLSTSLSHYVFHMGNYPEDIGSCLCETTRESFKIKIQGES
jgi:hypothetical protein